MTSGATTGATAGSNVGATRSVQGDSTAKNYEGQTLDTRFTYYSSTETINDSNTMAGNSAVGKLVVGDDNDPSVVGSAGSNFYPIGTVISYQNSNGQTIYHVVDDNNIGANNTKVENNHTFDLYTTGTNPGVGRAENAKVTIVSVPSSNQSGSQVEALRKQYGSKGN